MAEKLVKQQIAGLSSVSDVKTWKCKGGHLMGLVIRNGDKVQQLLLFREAVHDMQSECGHGDLANEFALDAVPLQSSTREEIDVMAVVEGYVADVRCSICRRVRTWVPGEEAMEHLLATIRGQTRGSAPTEGGGDGT